MVYEHCIWGAISCMNTTFEGLTLFMVWPLNLLYLYCMDTAFKDLSIILNTAFEGSCDIQVECIMNTVFE